MTNSLIRKAIFFVLGSLVFLAVAIFFSNSAIISNQKNEEIVESINDAIKNFESTSAADLDFFKTYLESNKKINFENLLENSKAPVTIFENGKIVFWTADAIIFDYSVAKKNFELLVQKTSTGKVLLWKHSFVFEKKAYVLVYQLWLSKKLAVKNSFFQSSLNREVFPEKVSKLNYTSGAYNIDSNGKFLFSIEFDDINMPNATSELFFVFGLVIIFIVCLVLGVSFFIRFLISKKLNSWAWFTLIALNLVFGGLIYIFKAQINQSIVFQWVDFDLIFNLALSISIFLLVFLPFRFNLTNSKRKSKIDLTKNEYIFLDATLLLINSFGLYGLYLIAKFWYVHPYYSFNIFNIGAYTSEKIVTLTILLLTSFCYFMVAHLIAQFLLRRKLQIGKSIFLNWIIITFLLSAILVWVFDFNLIILLLSAMYLFVVIWQSWTNTLLRPRYITYLYLFFCILVVSLTVSIASYLGEKEVLGAKAKKWAEKINKEAGVIDFEVLKTISDSIRIDTLVKKSFDPEVADFDLVEQSIQKNYIGKQFEEYECNAYLFDFAGNCINKNIKNYIYYYANYSKPKYRTQYQGIFKVQNNGTNYYCFVTIYENGKSLGYVILEFKLRRLIPNSILPALFQVKTASNSNNINPNFAIYKDSILISERGNLNLKQWIENPTKNKTQTLAEGGFDIGNYYQRFDFEEGKSVLISFKASILKVFVSNFSFIFAILSGVLAVFIFSNTFYFKLKQVSSTFTTKIQLFINIAFFLPLVAVSITSFTIMNGAFTSDLEKSYNEKVAFVSQNLSTVFAKYIQNRISIEELNEELENASKYVQSDIAIYDVSGKMIANTQPNLFDWAILSAYISPKAFSSIIERKELSIILDEKTGKFQFKTVYSPIKSYDSGVILGFVSIPFFESDFVFKEKVMESITTILNVFTFIFILFLSITYFFSRLLTLPLTLLTQKIKYTSLERNNEPLIYTASDEIGILVKEYNRMLKKLEENKKVLANTEKESAWREMAKQVAHEIKNPLTPMKLALQNMQRMLKTDRNDKDEIALRSADVLLEQIENLNEIAGSFSTFAQMPLPKKEPFELVKLINNVVFLFQSEREVQIDFAANIDHCEMIGDENMMSRIMINLVRNAIESVPEERNPVIQIRLDDTGENIEIKVKDNGKGIEESFASKIFQPNFSTKTSGSGIGLALAKRGLEQMGGKISFTSSVGNGTEFSIKLAKA